MEETEKLACLHTENYMSWSKLPEDQLIAMVVQWKKLPKGEDDGATSSKLRFDLYDMYVVAYEKNYIALAKETLEDTKCGYTICWTEHVLPLRLAAGAGRLEFVKMILDCEPMAINYDDCDCLNLAIRGRHIEVVAELLTRPDCHIYPSMLGELAAKSQKGDEELINLLLGFVENKKEYDHIIPSFFSSACFHRNRQVLDLLLKKYPNLEKVEMSSYAYFVDKEIAAMMESAKKSLRGKHTGISHSPSLSPEFDYKISWPKMCFGANKWKDV